MTKRLPSSVMIHTNHRGSGKRGGSLSCSCQSEWEGDDSMPRLLVKPQPVRSCPCDVTCRRVRNCSDQIPPEHSRRKKKINRLSFLLSSSFCQMSNSISFRDSLSLSLLLPVRVESETSIAWEWLLEITLCVSVWTNAEQCGRNCAMFGVRKVSRSSSIVYTISETARVLSKHLDRHRGARKLIFSRKYLEYFLEPSECNTFARYSIHQTDIPPDRQTRRKKGLESISLSFFFSYSRHYACTERKR